MKKQIIVKTESAVVGVFTVVLVISLILGVMTVINAIYVPHWLKEAEFGHNELVSNQFAQLKYALDIQSITNGSSVIDSPITLGTREIPFIYMHQTFDELSIPSKSCTLIIDSKTGSHSSYVTDSIKYSSHNTNYVDQSYIYEAGTLILNQYNESVMLARPSILVTEYSKNITITFINITGIGVNIFSGGRGTFPIYTQVIQNNQQFKVIHNVTNITIQTNYPTAWNQAFNISLLYSGINHEINQTNNRVTVHFIDSKGYYYNIFLKEIKVSADIAFGVIE
jgi:hypothetical protein